MEKQIHKIPVPGIKKDRKPIEYYVDENGCHVCVSHGKKTNYPQIGTERISKIARPKPTGIVRYLWEKKNGPIGAGLSACHRCDNIRCINLDHIFMGTPTENALDMVKKGRHLKENRIGISKVEGFERVNFPIRRGIYSELKLLARKDRRSTSNLINKILEDWIEGLKGGTNNA